MEITIYELIGLIKDDKAPKKIKIDGCVFYFNSYYISLENAYLDDEATAWYKIIDITFDKDVEILPEENDEWEDIEELDTYHQLDECIFIDKYYGNITGNLVDEVIADKVNQLIENQKYLKERLEINNLNKNITLDEWKKEI